MIEHNTVLFGLLIILIFIALLLLISKCSNANEHFSMMDTCDEMFHRPNHVAKCKSMNPDGTHRFEAGIQYTYPKYLKNKDDKVKLTEDLYWALVENMGDLSNLGKCQTVFWNDETMTESCTAKPRDIVNALYDVYWTNRFKNIEKTPEEYRAFLNSGVSTLKRAGIIHF